MSRRNRQHNDGSIVTPDAALDLTTVEHIDSDLAETVASVIDPIAEVETPAVVKRYVPKPGEWHHVDYMGRCRPLERKA